jgi:hypothetical protein
LAPGGRCATGAIFLDLALAAFAEASRCTFPQASACSVLNFVECDQSATAYVRELCLSYPTFERLGVLRWLLL